MIAVRAAALFAAAAAAIAAAQPARAQRVGPDLNGYVTLGSGSWSRGVSQNDGPSLQLGIDWQHQSGLFVGAWATNVDFAVDYSHDRPRRVETDAYVGYHDRSERWSWTTTLGRYRYPGAAWSYDYDELSATVGYRERVFYTASYSDDFYGWGRHALNQELAFALPLRGDVEIGATLGRFALESTGVDYTHWNVGVSKIVRRVVVDLRYYGSGLDQVGYLGDPDARHYVLSVSYGLHGKRSRI